MIQIPLSNLRVASKLGDEFYISLVNPEKWVASPKDIYKPTLAFLLHIIEIKAVNPTRVDIDVYNYNQTYTMTIPRAIIT